jgi:hypothetical protein
VAEGGGLLNRYRIKSSIGGSNPPLSASFCESARSDAGAFACVEVFVWRMCVAAGDRAICYEAWDLKRLARHAGCSAARRSCHDLEVVRAVDRLD